MTTHGLLRAYGIAVVALIVLPIALVIPMAFSSSEFLIFPPPGWSLQWFVEFFSSPEWTGPLTRSLFLASIAATFAVIVGGLGAWPISRTPFRGKSILVALIAAPLVVPPIALAIGTFKVWAGIGLLGSQISLVVTYVMLAVPYAVIIVGAALRDIDNNQLRAARSLGAGTPAIIRRVILPAVFPSVVASWVLAFLAAVDEVVLSSFLLRANIEPTLGVFVFSEIESNLQPTIAAASVVNLVAAVAIGVAATLRPRRFALT